MNKVISIHLHGVAFQLEEGGYEALRTYLGKAEQQLANNPDKAEILADIEQAIGDKFRAQLTNSRNVVLTAQVEAVIVEMGPVTNEDGPAPSPEPDAKPNTGFAGRPGEATQAEPPVRRLYRLKDGAMLAGVCNGLAAYLGIDVTLLRLVIAVLIFCSFGTVALAYLVAIIIIPKARTPEQKAAATGPTQTAHDFVRMAREGYYEGVKTFPDRHARREWRRKFRQEMRDWKHSFRWEHWTPPHWEPPVPTCPPSGGYSVAIPVLSTLKALFVFFFVFAILSLIATGSVFGLPLPGGLPVWAGVILLFLAYKVVVAPIKAMRRACYFRSLGQPYYWHPMTDLWQGLVTLGIVVLCVFLADLLVPGFHRALLALPDFLHNAADAVQQWWTRH